MTRGQAEYRAIRDAQAALGLCATRRCTERPAPGRQRCEAHLEQARQRAAARRRRLGPVRESPESARARRLRSVFGLTPEQYDEMLAAQGGVCAICRSACSSGRNLAVDHDHRTGRLRGLLCGKCNKGIGLLGDSAEGVLSALAYLQGGANG